MMKNVTMTMMMMLIIIMILGQTRTKMTTTRVIEQTTQPNNTQMLLFGHHESSINLCFFIYFLNDCTFFAPRRGQLRDGFGLFFALDLVVVAREWL